MLRHSSRKRPLKLSSVPFCQGLPGAMYAVSSATVAPSRAVVEAQGLEAATRAFDMISDVFVEHAPGEALHLLPGHAYFLAKSVDELRQRLGFEVIPLIDEYLQQGLLGPASTELFAVRDSLDDMVQGHAGEA